MSINYNKKNIRLNNFEIDSIKKIAFEIFGHNTKIWIFGSRVNKNLKGGDIDIYIEVKDFNNIIDNIVEKKIDFLVKL